ncbi:hypothetical protein RRSWK_02777 [Rhodopirellula sp. SWK7]|nr:hypothetical protein RRSWK_02777 [Rhodopirellula sp. SWK7]
MKNRIRGQIHNADAMRGNSRTLIKSGQRTTEAASRESSCRDAETARLMTDFRQPIPHQIDLPISPRRRRKSDRFPAR